MYVTGLKNGLKKPWIFFWVFQKPKTLKSSHTGIGFL